MRKFGACLVRGCWLLGGATIDTDSLSLAKQLRGLAAQSVTCKADLASWYVQSRLIQEALKFPGVRDAVPKDLWNGLWQYLFDADIRLRDPEYARVQGEFISELISRLERA